jgi:hypothetical protein
MQEWVSFSLLLSDVTASASGRIQRLPSELVLYMDRCAPSVHIEINYIPIGYDEEGERTYIEDSERIERGRIIPEGGFARLIRVF